MLIKSLLSLVFFVLVFFESGCSKNTTPIEGFWVSTKGDIVVEFTSSEVKFSYFNEKKHQATLHYKEVDPSHYSLYGDGAFSSEIATVDWATKTLKLSNIAKRTFVKAPSITAKDILGQWYSKDKEGDVETITISTQKMDSYDFETITINHKDKTIKREMDKDVLFVIKNGFIFTDLGLAAEKFNKEDTYVYVYCLTGYSEKALQFTEVDGGSTWLQYKLDKPEDLGIPKDYVLVK